MEGGLRSEHAPPKSRSLGASLAPPSLSPDSACSGEPVLCDRPWGATDKCILQYIFSLPCEEHDCVTLYFLVKALPVTLDI